MNFGCLTVQTLAAFLCQNLYRLLRLLHQMLLHAVDPCFLLSTPALEQLNQHPSNRPFPLPHFMHDFELHWWLAAEVMDLVHSGQSA